MGDDVVVSDKLGVVQKILEVFHELFVDVQSVLWSTSRISFSQTFVVYRRVFGDYARFNQKVVFSSDKSGCNLVKSKLNAVIQINFFMMSFAGLSWIRQSRFRSHVKFYRMFVDHCACSGGGRVRAAMFPWMIYQWINLEHMDYVYVGKTNRTYVDRIMEHNKQLPAYHVMRSFGHSSWFPIPMFSVQNSCEAELLLIEHQVVIRFHSRFNTPFVNRYSKKSPLPDVSVAQRVRGIVHAPRQSFMRKSKADIARRRTIEIFTADDLTNPCMPETAREANV